MAGKNRIGVRSALRIGLSVLLAVGAASGAHAAERPLVEHLYGWGEPGTGTGRFRAVRGIVAYDRKSIDRTIIVVADGGRDLLRSYTWDMMFIDKWGSAGSAPGEFHEPRGVAIDGDGNVIVADAANHRVQKTAVGTSTFLQRPGEPVLAFGTHGNADGQFNRPTGVAVDASGNILVADTENHRIQKFDPKGKFLAAWGARGSGDGMFFLPSYVAVASNGNIYVSDSGNNRIQVLDAKGKYLSTIGSIGSRPGYFAEPKGLAFDAAGDLWVVDRRNHRLQKFAKDGRSLGVFGSQGPGNDQFSYPEDLAFDSGGRLYVTDGMNGRIQVFKPTLNH